MENVFEKNVKIRKATKNDFDIICKFIDAIDDFETTLCPVLSNSEKQRLAVRKEVEENLKSPNKCIFLAENNEGGVIGTVIAVYHKNVRPKFTKRKVGIVNDLFVSEKFRKKGVATQLIECAKQWLREKGVSWFEVYMCVNNSASFAAFSKTGFKPYAYIMHCYE